MSVRFDVWMNARVTESIQLKRLNNTSNMPITEITTSMSHTKNTPGEQNHQPYYKDA